MVTVTCTCQRGAICAKWVVDQRASRGRLERRPFYRDGRTDERTDGWDIISGVVALLQGDADGCK